MQIQKPTIDTSLEFIENPEILIARLHKIKSKLSNRVGGYVPIRAYITLLDAAICHLKCGQNKILYFPIPWETDTGLPSHPSLVADARHYCRAHHLDAAAGVIVGSFAEWQIFQRQKIFCCCGKSSVIYRERTVPIEIVMHHPVIVDRKSGTLEIKQLVGIRSTDRDHIENHYDLRRDSRVDDNISIIRTASVQVGVSDFKLQTFGEESAKQFDSQQFNKIFTELCQNAFTRPS